MHECVLEYVPLYIFMCNFNFKQNTKCTEDYYLDVNVYDAKQFCKELNTIPQDDPEVLIEKLKNKKSRTGNSRTHLSRIYERPKIRN